MNRQDYIEIMNYIDGITVIDKHGKIVYSVRYNPRFDNDVFENEYNSIINRHLLEVYTDLDPDESTMLNCIKYGKPIYMKEQRIRDYKGTIINNENLTLPIIRSGKILGAIELSRDITKINEDINTRIMYKVKNRKAISSTSRTMYNFSDIITANKKMLENIKRAKLIANSSLPVLIYGETGTGKELFVQSIHNYSNRRNKPFIAQNCAALPENLFESILFGSAKGAFTGSIDKPGLFEEANGGTLFLDEINSMPLSLQAKLLRVLENGRVRRLGDSKEREVDVRIITAMNIDPELAIKQKFIREDLFYRLSVVNIKLVPLRERKEDIPIYIKHFISKCNEQLEKNITGVSKEVEELFYKYDWPGNVRELRHVIESSATFVEDNEIKIKHLPVYLDEKAKLHKNGINKGVNDRNHNHSFDEFLQHSSFLDDVIEKVEKVLITKALEEAKGNLTKAAGKLGITRQRLRYKIDKYRISYEQ